MGRSSTSSTALTTLTVQPEDAYPRRRQQDLASSVLHEERQPDGKADAARIHRRHEVATFPADAYQLTIGRPQPFAVARECLLAVQKLRRFGQL